MLAACDTLGHVLFIFWTGMRLPLVQSSHRLGSASFRRMGKKLAKKGFAACPGKPAKKAPYTSPQVLISCLHSV